MSKQARAYTARKRFANPKAIPKCGKGGTPAYEGRNATIISAIPVPPAANLAYHAQGSAHAGHGAAREWGGVAGRLVCQWRVKGARCARGVNGPGRECEKLNVERQQL